MNKELMIDISKEDFKKLIDNLSEEKYKELIKHLISGWFLNSLIKIGETIAEQAKIKKEKKKNERTIKKR